jgi:DNA polymerase elongation subunit (family B)
MSYVDAIYNREKDRIHVVERSDTGQRVYRELSPNHVFYYDDPRGKFRSIFGTPVSRFSSKNNKEFKKEIRMHAGKNLYESDFNPVFRCLEENYRHIDAPKLNVAYFDIEVDFHAERGYSPIDDPFNAITAITVYLTWTKQLITLALPPPTISWKTAESIANEFDNTIIFDREEDLLNSFLDIIDDADALSGWNSEGFDIPYTVNRVTRVLSKDDSRRFCLWGQYPKSRIFERYGAEQMTYDTIGRVHVDYMQLYRKYTYEERHSYSLDAIAEYELGERKVAYDGTLDQLYKQDFKKFLDYNRQDTLIIAKLDEKLKFLDLANTLAHENTVLIQTTMGAVAVTEQAIINEAHDRGLVVPNRKDFSAEDSKAAGAYVAYPKKGMHDYVGSIDINSLYPSTIRALNMGPETIIGQLRPVMTDQFIKERMADKYVNGRKYKGCSFAAAWEGLFASLEYTAVMEQKAGVEVIIDWNNGNSDTFTALEVWNLIFNSKNPWVISANGTIFTIEHEAVIPGLLKRWYAERKELQKSLKEAINSGDKKAEEYWDKRQLVKKINLNSLYGAILNAGCRFFDKRIGQSTTLTGRSIAKHMDAYVNQCITGVYDHMGDSIIYGDTDSCYFSAWPIVKDDVEKGIIEWSKDIAVKLYDSISDQVNESFPPFMEQAFHCPQSMGEVIRGGREIVAIKGLFITKKRYAVLYYDKEGKRVDVNGSPGKIKAMGLDLKRSDTPKIVQEFLSDLLDDVLIGTDRSSIVEKIVKFKLQFAELPSWEKGSPKRVNNLTKYTAMYEKDTKADLPGHVRAAVNWNVLRKMNNDNYSTKVIDGAKTIVCKLLTNPLGITSIAYPTDEAHLPDWFKELNFDDNEMMSVNVDKKVDNLLGVLNWNLEMSTDTTSTFTSLFSNEDF